MCIGRAKSTDDESNAIHEYLKSIITALERYLLLVNRKTSISTSDQAPQTTLSQLLLIWNHLYQQYTDYLIDRDETVRQMLKQLQKFEEENILLKEIISTHSRFSNENTMVILRDYQQKLIKYRNSLRNQDFATTTATTTLTSSDSQSNVKTIFEHASSQTVYCDIDEAANIIDQQSARSRKISVQAETQTAAAATTVKTPLPVQKPTLNAAAQTDCLPQPHAVERSPTSLEQEVLDEQVGHLVVDQLNKCWPVAAVPSEPPIKLSDKALLTPNQPVEAQAVTRNPAYDPDDEIAQMSQAELVRTVKDRNGEVSDEYLT
jgi:hypothetical protein